MISIIIPAHKEGKNIVELLSILSAIPNNGDTEIIVALSPQSEANIPASINGEFQMLNCVKKGRAAQMNQGAALAKGDVLVFLHADVKPPKTFISDIIEAMNAGFDAGFFSYQFDTDSILLKINASFTGRDGIFTGGGDQCLFIRKSIFKKLGGFDEEHVLMEDFDFFKRMKRAKVPYTIVNQDLIVSARKYEYNSYLRVNLSNLLLVVLFNVGYPSAKLKSIHDKLIRSS